MENIILVFYQTVSRSSFFIFYFNYRIIFLAFSLSDFIGSLHYLFMLPFILFFGRFYRICVFVLLFNNSPTFIPLVAYKKFLTL